MHLNGNYTRISFNEGRHWVDVETDKIPCELRSIGSSVAITLAPVHPTDLDSPDDIRGKVSEAIRIAVPKRDHSKNQKGPLT